MSEGCPETGSACARACGSRWCVLKAQRLVAQQAAAESRVRLLPLARPEDVALGVAIDRRIQVDLAEQFVVEAKAVRVESAPDVLVGLVAGQLPAGAPSSADEAKTVHAATPLLDAGLAGLIRREREIAGIVASHRAEAKAVHVDAVPDPLPLPPVPATNPIRAARPAPPVPGMRFAWATDELIRPIPRQES